jgi:hypothetical protein
MREWTSRRIVVIGRYMQRRNEAFGIASFSASASPPTRRYLGTSQAVDAGL